MLPSMLRPPAPPANSSPSGQYFHNVVSHEIRVSNLGPLKKKESARLQANKSVKASSVLVNADLAKIRHQLDTLPEGFREHLRLSYARNQASKRQERQDAQCGLLTKFEKVLRTRWEEMGLDFRKFRVGGIEGGLYEMMYKIEPSPFMSKAQFMAVMRRLLKIDIIGPVGKLISKLYASFDPNENDTMDWRMFLCFLIRVIQPGLSSMEHMRISYALYACIGFLDVNTVERVKLEDVKDLVTAAVRLDFRDELKQEIDFAWADMCHNDEEVIEMNKFDYLRDSEMKRNIKITRSMYETLLTKSPFAKYMAVGEPFGRLDLREWLSVLEKDYFHPSIVAVMAALRLEERNERETDLFLRKIEKRRMNIAYCSWVRMLIMRAKLRKTLAALFVHRVEERTGRLFDVWKATTMRIVASEHIQRVVRGFLGRRRSALTASLHRRALSIQAPARQLTVRIQYNAVRAKRTWAAVTIQRYFRGTNARAMTYKRVQAELDTGRRMLQKARENFVLERQTKAATCVARRIRTFLRRMKAYKKFKKLEEIERVAKGMDKAVREAEKAKHVYRNDLTQWYINRKSEYDKTIMNDKQSRQQRDQIFRYRNRHSMAIKQQKEKDRLAKDALAEEQRVEAWLIHWDEVKAQRAKAKGTICKNAMNAPVTPEEVALKRVLAAKIKDQVKVVLRRADKMRIPMEIPEAQEIAQKDVIEMEVLKELEDVHNEMVTAGKQYEKQQEAKKRHEQRRKHKEMIRKQDWAALVIQGSYRIWKARAMLRRKAYKRYVKYFDAHTGNYYYMEKRSKVTMWDKPLSLGSYDIDGAEGWVMMKTNTDDTYYYNPKSWKMVWEMPHGTTPCALCKTDFAAALLINDNKKYCEACLNTVVQGLIEQKVSAADIGIKMFKGNHEKSKFVDFSRIKLETWMTHLVLGGMSAEEILKERREEAKKAKEKKKLEDKRKREEIPVYPCSKCGEENATRDCFECSTKLCSACYDRRHKKPPWSLHSYTDIKQPPPVASVSTSVEGMTTDGRSIDTLGETDPFTILAQASQDSGRTEINNIIGPPNSG